MTHIARQLMLLVAAGAVVLSAGAQERGVSRLSLDIGPSTVSGGEAARGRISVARDPKVPPQALQFRLGSSHSNLVRFPSAEVTIAPNQDSAQFELATAATPIRAPVTITAHLGPAYATKAQAELVLVPALINRVTLNKPTMTGTRGTTIECTAELKAPAPAGGIELYLSPLDFSPRAAGDKASNPPLLENPRIPAGSRTVTFSIRYNDLVSMFSSLSFNDRDFSQALESQTRSVELVVALDPQQKVSWQPIPDRAVKVTFDLVPLRINSMTVQPSSVVAGAEAVATFTLSAPPGSGETVVLGSTKNAIGAVLLGSSCQGAPAGSPTARSVLELQLTPGTTTHSFKVCARPVPAVTTGEVIVIMRSGQYKTGFTVQP